MVNEDIPRYGSAEAQNADIVRCGFDETHIGSRKAFENEGGCPYCLRTPAERAAAQRKQNTTD